MKNKIIILTLALGLGVFTLSSCAQTHNCPTYATSGPSKVKKQKKRNGISAGNTKKVKKLDKGKPMSGL